MRQRNRSTPSVVLICRKCSSTFQTGNKVLPVHRPDKGPRQKGRQKGSRGRQKGSRLYKRQKKLIFCPTTKRLEAFVTMRADLLMCGIGRDAHGFLNNKGMVVSERPRQKGSRLYKRQKKLIFYPTTKRLEAFVTMRANFLMCGIGSEVHGFLNNKGTVVSEAPVPFGQA